jgi:hypothetical protein
MFLPFIFAMILNAHATDAISEACKRDVRAQTAARAKYKDPNITAQKIDAAINGQTPAAEYVVQADTAVCMADKMKLALELPANFKHYCFMSPAKTRIGCFQAWLKKQEVSYAKQVVQLAQTAFELAKKDMSAPNQDAGRATAAMIDVWLTSLERYSVIKNVAFKPGSGRERDEIRKQEIGDFEKARKAVLEMAEEEWKSLSALTKAMPKDKQKTLGPAYAELNLLRNRIVKLKKTKK